MADEREQQLKTVATVLYALQALGFFVGITWIVAVIIDYVKKDDAAGTWLASHYSWQIRTFWWGLLWGVIGGILVFVIVGFLVLAADAIWIIYRIVKGWLRLPQNPATCHSCEKVGYEAPRCRCRRLVACGPACLMWRWRRRHFWRHRKCRRWRR